MTIYKNIIISLFLVFAFILYAYCMTSDNLTCLELKTVMSSRFESSNEIEYFYIDPKNHKVYTENLRPVNEVTCFDDKWIKFKTISPAFDKDYNIIKVYRINRYTGSVERLNYSRAEHIGAKVVEILGTGTIENCEATGTGTAKAITKPKKQF